MQSPQCSPRWEIPRFSSDLTSTGEAAPRVVRASPTARVEMEISVLPPGRGGDGGCGGGRPWNRRSGGRRTRDGQRRSLSWEWTEQRSPEVASNGEDGTEVAARPLSGGLQPWREAEVEDRHGGQRLV